MKAHATRKATRRDSVAARPSSTVDRRSPLKVLLVDDSDADRMRMARILRSVFRDAEILEAEDGASAIETLSKRVVDLVLVDYRLPDMDGLEVVDHIGRAAPATAAILMTGQGNEKLAAEAIKRGAQDYLVKGRLDAGELEQTVRLALRSAQNKRQSSAMAQQLSRTHRELDHFVRALSHDMSANFMLLDHSFRQFKRSCDSGPLAGLSGNLAHVEACLRESKRYVDDLVLLAKTGSIQMEPDRVELDRVVAEVAFEQRELLAERGVQFLAQPGLPAVWCNEARVKQVLTNLVRNACRHGCDPRRPRIEVSRADAKPGDAADGRAWIQVWDNGPGIPAAKRDEIFLPGKRLPGAHEQGSGMGLAIVRKVIEHYGGSVTVADCPSGTAFEFSLPAAPEADSTSG